MRALVSSKCIVPERFSLCWEDEFPLQEEPVPFLHLIQCYVEGFRGPSLRQEGLLVQGKDLGDRGGI